jgi:hypothetical protein
MKLWQEYLMKLLSSDDKIMIISASIICKYLSNSMASKLEFPKYQSFIIRSENNIYERTQNVIDTQKSI